MLSNRVSVVVLPVCGCGAESEEEQKSSQEGFVLLATLFQELALGFAAIPPPAASRDARELLPGDVFSERDQLGVKLRKEQVIKRLTALVDSHGGAAVSSPPGGAATQDSKTAAAGSGGGDPQLLHPLPAAQLFLRNFAHAHAACFPEYVTSTTPHRTTPKAILVSPVP